MSTKKSHTIVNALCNWSNCNGFLRTASEADARAILEAEAKGQQRVQFMLRAHSRFNRLRAARERAELLKRIDG